ncbi:MAG: 1,4-dihydroxy-6-naphthoate synthase [Bacteroidota bacterium]
MKKIISLGYSPCPNDCFIFDAIANKKIVSDTIEFEIVLEDVETLNKRAISDTEKKLDVSKLSFATLIKSSKLYSLADSGAALGENCGPLLICRANPEEQIDKINELSIAIPGTNTTANLLLKFAFPNAKNKVELVFSEIENSVLTGKTELGLIIHENRFTYHKKGLKKVIDLGEYWQEKTNMPIPLGGIGISNALEDSIKIEVQRMIKESIKFAFNNPESSNRYVLEHSQEMEKEVIEQHIKLYVNNYSVSLGELGKMAVNYLFETEGLKMGADFIIY